MNDISLINRSLILYLLKEYSLDVATFKLIFRSIYFYFISTRDLFTKLYWTYVSYVYIPYSYLFEVYFAHIFIFQQYNVTLDRKNFYLSLISKNKTNRPAVPVVLLKNK